MIDEQPILFFIYPGENLSYISPQKVENYKMTSEKFQQTWLAQLTTRTKRKLTHKPLKSTVNLNGYETKMNLNTFLVGSYDVLV